MPDDRPELDEHDKLPYQPWHRVNFGVITMGLKKLPHFQDDLYLGMQAMNVGIADSVITEREYALLREYVELERTPVESAMPVSALSQMWMYGLYEVLRMWRERRYDFEKLHQSGGVEQKLRSMPDDDPYNLTIEIRRRQLARYKKETAYREAIDATWQVLEPVYRKTELFRMNLAKHCAPGKNGVMPRAPGYGRINQWCGAMDYELVDREGFYTTMNRRDIADALRECLDLRTA